MRAEQQLKTFLRILNEYPANTPLTKFLPGFFKMNKQMGSTDRRTASRLIYSYFRIGKALAERPVEERLYIAEFLCNTEDNSFLAHFRPELNEKISLPVEEKINFLQSTEGFVLEDVFPFTNHLSAGIDKQAFLHSLFIQPDLYIRTHPGKQEVVKSKLTEAGITFREISETALTLPNGTNLNQLFPENITPMPFRPVVIRPYVVQDLSSQQTAAFFKPNRYESWWDACAASGGKSLLLFSLESDIKLVVSDIRESVLNNLDERFIAAGFRTYQKKIIDLTQNSDPELHGYEFDGIILDTPCSGSGTWGRTPEMISQFEEFKIQTFHNLQKTIASNTVKYLKSGKPLIYITCSVFKEENEEMVNYLVKELGLTVESQEIIKGYEHKADTMFVARLISK
ncbi:RsmB/NOP family class I SAM-dependent RNA methyltransferase [Daejeonella oryzae]|uniref:RNA methyltransferase n=1 Tax=Daejeonella oryzae TaxID=1122943 RepID=UPI000426C642|nr:RNA methyltransferase [Daejeonella oryzae]